MRDPLRLGIGGHRIRPRAGHHVVLGAGAVGGIGGREVGQVEQGLAHLLLGGVGRDPDLPLLLAQLAAAVGQFLGRRRIGALRSAGLAHLLGQRLHLGPEIVAPADGRSGRLVQNQQMVHLGRVHTPSAQCRLHRGAVLSHPADIDHCGTTVA